MDGLIFIYLVLFPFGKLSGVIPDVMIGIIVIVGMLSHRDKLRLSKFVVICIFSLLFSLSFFKLSALATGILYLLRLIAYILFSKVIFQQFGHKKKKRELLLNSLIGVGIFIAIFGWIQYFVFSDIRFLKAIGWDDHYFRLVSTYLDPAFTGILLVFTEVLVISKRVKKHSIQNLLLNLFLVFTILFTYSRASYLALLVVFVFLFLKYRDKFIIFLASVFVSLIFFLPQPHSEGVHLTRTYSITQKFVNYDESLKLITKSPIFGIGFDNVCVAKEKFLSIDNSKSHTCSGLDNSILFIIATTGIVGLLIFSQFIYKTLINTKLDSIGWGLIFS